MILLFNRKGCGAIFKCRGCQEKFMVFTDQWGIHREMTLANFDLDFHTHQVECLDKALEVYK